MAGGEINLDRIVNIPLDDKTAGRYHNELQVLLAWFNGLQFLYAQTRLLEKHSTAQLFSALSTEGNNAKSLPSRLVFGNLSCCFQWYAVTLCNFVELTGTIGWELDSTRKPPRDYIKEVIPAVLDYRNNVGAHIARARKNNPAEQLVSLLPPSTLANGRYMAGVWAIHLKRSGNSSVGQRQPWSLTETHEQLKERYWPGLDPL
jgi:hypothetical protein